MSGDSPQQRNVRLNGRRTSIRLETYMWQALDEICSREGVEFEHLCGRLERTLEGGSLAAALRVYALNFYRRVKL